MGIVEEKAGEIGFDCMGPCDTTALKTRPEVRDMCAANLCQSYGHSWSCPPACGAIDEYEQRMREYDRCLVVQTVGQMEDAFDYETVAEAGQTHHKRMNTLVKKLEEAGVAHMPLGAGTCRLCPQCAYPDDPCRFPDKMMVSMEAAGLVVAEVCKLADIPYNHGENTISFSGCILY